MRRVLTCFADGGIFDFSMKNLVFIYVYIILVTASLSFAQSNIEERTDDVEEICKDKSYEKMIAACETPPGLFPYKVAPSNVTELEKYCSIVNTYLPCFLKWQLICDLDTKFASGYTLEACDEGSTLHERVKENIECMYGAYEKFDNNEFPCDSQYDEVVDVYKKFNETKMADLFPQLSEDAKENIGKMLWVFNELGCFLNHMECPNAIDVLLEIVTKRYTMFETIVSELKEVILEVLDHLPLKDKQKQWTRNSMEQFVDECEKLNCKGYEDKLRKLYVQ